MSQGAGATVARMRGKPRSASGDVPAPGCSPQTTDTSVPGSANCLPMIVSARIVPAGSMVAVW